MGQSTDSTESFIRMTDLDLPEPSTERRGQRLSWVWIMPVLALVVAIGMVWQTYGDRGRVITVTFPAAQGIEAGKTPLRFRDLDVGFVENITFSDGLSAIEVHIRLDRDIAPYVDADAQFWLVEPRVSTRGITGLTTVLSGVYIEGSWDGTPAEAQTTFVALDKQPLFSPGEAGTRVVLRARSGGQLSAGAPVIFNGIDVGWIGEPVLSETGLTVTRDVFVRAPYDRRLTTATRFWDSSGLSLEIGTSGVTLNANSLAALVEGGVTFGTMVTGGQPIRDGHVYDVFNSLSAAREDALEGIGTKLSLSVLLPTDVARLTEGTPVRFGQVGVGEITMITGFLDPEATDEGMQLLVDIEVTPERLGVPADLAPDAQIAALEKAVEDGLRLRVAYDGILGQRTILEFVYMDDAAPARLLSGKTDHPLLPTGPDRTDRTEEGIDGLVARISSLPIEDLMTSAIGALDSVRDFAGNAEMQGLPANANGLISDARALVGSEDLLAAFRDIETAATDLQALTSAIRESDGLTTLLAALESSDEIVYGLSTFSSRLPTLADDMEAITTKVRAMPLDDLTVSLDALAQQLTTILDADGVEEMPERIVSVLSELQEAVSDLREGGAVENLNKTLLAAERSLQAIEVAAGQLPDVVARLDSAVAALQSTASGYAPGSRLHVELTGAIRDISEAADGFRSLARTIERNPNALITGR